MDLHRGNPDAGGTQFQARVTLRSHDVTEMNCPAIKTQWASLRSCRWSCQTWMGTSSWFTRWTIHSTGTRQRWNAA